MFSTSPISTRTQENEQNTKSFGAYRLGYIRTIWPYRRSPKNHETSPTTAALQWKTKPFAISFSTTPEDQWKFTGPVEVQGVNLHDKDSLSTISFQVCTMLPECLCILSKRHDQSGTWRTLPTGIPLDSPSISRKLIASRPVRFEYLIRQPPMATLGWLPHRSLHAPRTPPTTDLPPQSEPDGPGCLRAGVP